MTLANLGKLYNHPVRPCHRRLLSRISVKILSFAFLSFEDLNLG